MKICFYINVLGGGGAERVIANLATQFSQIGHSVSVITSYPVKEEYELGKNVSKYRLEEKEIKSSALNRNFRRIFRLRRLIKSEKPDVIVSFMAEPNFRMLLATLGIKCRKIISVRNDPNKEYPNLLFRFLAKTIYNLADGIVFQTEDAKKWFPKSIQKKSRIIMNQVDDVFFNTPLAEKRHDIVTTGRLTAQKNHIMLIHAFSQIANEIEDNLIIYGEGELRRELEDLVRELGLEKRVFLPGSTRNVPEVLSKAKIFVLSSDYEGMPNSLLEAMAMGLPCISTDCPSGGAREVLSAVGEEHLVDVRNINEMSRVIKKLCTTNSESLDEISKATKNKALFFKSDVVFIEWKNCLEVK